MRYGSFFKSHRPFAFYAQKLLIFMMMLAILMPLPAFAQTRQPITIAVLGDSLSAGYNLPAAAAFPAVLERALKERGHAVTMINAAVSGDTTRGGLERLDWSIPEGTDGAILELGANDMLRGQNPAITKKTLETIILKLKERNISVLLAGMKAAPNLGADYGAQFNALYADLANKHDLLLYPFFLEGVSGNEKLNLPDGMHPNAKGVERIVQGIIPVAEEFLKKIELKQDAPQ
jgi:acyl-CoA thioesterase I